MIHLDTSFLIRGLVAGSPEDRRLRSWLRAREVIRISALVWAEFLCGPINAVTAEEAAEFLGQPVDFGGTDALLAAQLFNESGRRRGIMIDCIVAATAIRHEAPLATSNVADFRRFLPFGLTLA